MTYCQLIINNVYVRIKVEIATLYATVKIKAKIKIMTYQEANNISIKDYLESLGILPVVDKLYYGMYHSPLRQDDTPSFKVDYGVNLWCDFGTGEGGSLNCTNATLTGLSADWNRVITLPILFLFKGKVFQKGMRQRKKRNSLPAR